MGCVEPQFAARSCSQWIMDRWRSSGRKEKFWGVFQLGIFTSQQLRDGSKDGRGFAKVLVVAISHGMLHRVHGHTLHA